MDKKRIWALRIWGELGSKVKLPGVVGMEVVQLAGVTELAFVQTQETNLSCAPNLFPATTKVQNTKFSKPHHFANIYSLTKTHHYYFSFSFLSW